MHRNGWIAYAGLTYPGSTGIEPALEALDAAFAAFNESPSLETLGPYRTAFVAWQDEQAILGNTRKACLGDES